METPWKIKLSAGMFAGWGPWGLSDISVREYFRQMGNKATKEFHSCVLLEHKKLRSARFPEIAFFGISRCCANSFFREERITKPFSVFLFLFEVNLAKYFQNLIWTRDVLRQKQYNNTGNNTRRSTLEAAYLRCFSRNFVHEIALN